MIKKCLANLPQDKFQDISKEPGAAASLESEITSLLECPICFETSLPPIYSCKIGHTICHRCRPKIKVCPICKAEYSGCRIFFAENLAFKQDFKCEYESEGCIAIIKGSQYEAHKTTCEHRDLYCVLPKCQIFRHAIKFSKYVTHFRNHHSTLLATCSGDQTTWDLEMFISDKNHVFKVGPHIPFVMCIPKYNKEFLQCMHVEDNLVWIWVAVSGIEVECKQYQVKIVIKTKSGELDLLWGGPPHSIQKSPTQVRNSGLCLVTTVNVLKTFLKNLNGKYVWYMKVTIMRIAS